MNTDRERRQHPRAPVTLLIQYRFDTFEAFVVEYIEDLSEGGLRIYAPEQTRPPGSIVHVQFMLRDGVRLIEALCRVVRVEASPTMMALAFVDLDAGSKALIRRLVRERPDIAMPTEADTEPTAEP